MNIKAEKIDQIIQLINRNLLLISYGQDIQPLEFKNVPKMDTAVFGHDKFAFDMIHYIQTYKKFRVRTIETMHSMWEQDFVTGLEALMVECAIVKDEIERDCFVSRVYRWFSEKLAEYQRLPKLSNGYSDKYNPNSVEIEIISKQSTNDSLVYSNSSSSLENNRSKTNFPMIGQLPSSMNVDSGNGLRSAIKSSKTKENKKSVALSDQFSVPNIFRQNSQMTLSTSVDENYGMSYNKPETEAEKKMYELWLARRKQEVFDWKAQQQVDLVMSRLALHKSRLETNALRKQETNAMIAIAKDGENYSHPPDNNVRYAPSTRTMIGGRSHQIANIRAMNAQKHFRNSSNNDNDGGDKNENEDEDRNLSPTDRFHTTSSSRVFQVLPHDSNTMEENRRGGNFHEENSSNINGSANKLSVRYDSKSSLDNGNGSNVDLEGNSLHESSQPSLVEAEESIISTNSTFQSNDPNKKENSKNSKNLKKGNNTNYGKREMTPMRFGNKLPTGYEIKPHSIGYGMNSNGTNGIGSGGNGGAFLSSDIKIPSTTVSDKSREDMTEEHISSKFHRNRDYMQQSDSDDDDKLDIQMNAKLNTIAIHGKQKRSIKTVSALTFKRDKPVIRERPQSAKLFHSFANDDSELKIHYRHCNYRRMPISDKLEEWLEEREAEREKKSKEYAKKLFDENLLKKEKKVGKDIRPSSARTALSSRSSGESPRKTSNIIITPDLKIPKYQSATEFMAKHFPNFDNYDPAVDYEYNRDLIGPMRTVQLIECAQIMSAFEEYQIPMDENIVRKALMIPQDRPEAICLEDLRDPKNDEGLMVNPLPKEYWRKFKFPKKVLKKKRKV